LHLFHRVYGHARLGAGDAFAFDLCTHLDALWTGPLNGDADKGRILVALKPEPDTPRGALAGAAVCVELLDRLTITVIEYSLAPASHPESTK
jgi:hypothetical protein